MESAKSQYGKCTQFTSSLTISDESSRELIIIIFHQSQIQCSAIANFIISIVETSLKQHADTLLDFWILLPDTEFGQRSNCCSTHDRIFQYNSIVDVTNVLCWLRSLWSFHAKHVQNTHGKFGEFAIFDELTQVCQRLVPRFWHELDKIEHAFHHTALEVVAALVAQNSGKEREHAGLLGWEL